MPDRSKASLGIAAVALCLIMGTFAACSELPTAANDGEKDPYGCIWIDNILYCHPT